MPSELVNVDDEYRKFPEMQRDEVLKLVEWVRQQPHLPNLGEAFVILFYHACYYSSEQTKKTIDIHYTTRTHCPEFFSNCDPLSAELEKAMRTVTIIPLDKSTPEGYRIILAKVADVDPSNFNFGDTMKLYTMVFDLWLYREGIAAGHLMVMDMTGCSLGHVARLGLMTMKKFLFFLQEAAAIRLMGLHYINIVPFIDKVLALMTPFMKKELKNMLHIHSDMETFYKIVPQKIMPAEYGGCEEDSSKLREVIYQRVRDHREKYLELEKTFLVNEKVRPGKPKSASAIFGVEGNFKKLDFD